MIQRQHVPHRPGKGKTRNAPPPPVISVLPNHTVPLPPVPAADEEESAIFGFPADLETDGVAQRLAARLPDLPHGDSETHLVVLRRREMVGGLALVLAGTAADVSLWVPWWRASGATGLVLVRQGLAVSSAGPAELGRSGLWQPVVVVLGGGLLFLLGLLLFRSAPSHRPLGVLALLVALVAGTGVVVPLADANWSAESFGPGMWVAAAVALLGLLGAVKAMVTAPQAGADPA